MTQAKYVKRIESIIEEHQRVQMANPPTSEKWKAASTEINRLARLIVAAGRA